MSRKHIPYCMSRFKAIFTFTYDKLINNAYAQVNRVSSLHLSSNKTYFIRTVTGNDVIGYVFLGELAVDRSEIGLNNILPM